MRQFCAVNIINAYSCRLLRYNFYEKESSKPVQKKTFFMKSLHIFLIIHVQGLILRDHNVAQSKNFGFVVMVLNK